MPGKTPDVVFISHWAKKLGGAEYSLLDILSFSSTRTRPYLVTSENGLLTARAAEQGIACHIIPCKLRPGTNMRKNMVGALLSSVGGLFSFIHFVRSLLRFIKAKRPKIIHANVPLSHVALFLLVLAGYRGRCVFHMREIFKKNSLPFLLYRLLFPSKVGHIIAISDSVKKHLPDPLQLKAVVIHNGVHVPVSFQQRLNTVSAQTRFLYLGRIVPWKGCHDLVEIFTKVSLIRPDKTWSLSLVGDTTYWSDTYRRRLEELLRSNSLMSNCVLAPHTDDPGAVMRSHDVFVNASFQEPFGRSIAEAQAAGLPVVAFDSGGIREIIEHEKTGLLIPYGDKERFIQAVIRMMDNRDESGLMGKRGHNRMKQFFNRDIQIPKIFAEILFHPKG